MADAAPPAAAATPKQKTQKKKTASKPKKPAIHPKYSEMIKAAIIALKERSGSSRQAITKYLKANYKVGDDKSVNTHIKLALKNGVKNGHLKQCKGTGASGSFKVPDGAKASKKPKPKKAKKPKAAKPKKTKTKKVAKPKTAKPKSTKPKTASKPKKVSRSPKKKAAAKPKSAKPKTKKTTKSPKKKAPAKK